MTRRPGKSLERADALPFAPGVEGHRPEATGKELNVQGPSHRPKISLACRLPARKRGRACPGPSHAQAL